MEVHIYDHHGAGQDWGTTSALGYRSACDIEPVGATTTLLVEQLMDSTGRLTAAEATVLALGLYEETGSWPCIPRPPRDLEAAAFVPCWGRFEPGDGRRCNIPLIGSDRAAERSAAIRRYLLLEGRKILVASSAC